MVLSSPHRSHSLCLGVRSAGQWAHPTRPLPWWRISLQSALSGHQYDIWSVHQSIVIQLSFDVRKLTVCWWLTYKVYCNSATIHWLVACFALISLTSSSREWLLPEGQMSCPYQNCYESDLNWIFTIHGRGTPIRVPLMLDEAHVHFFASNCEIYCN